MINTFLKKKKNILKQIVELKNGIDILVGQANF